MSFNPELRKERNFLFVVFIIFAITGGALWWMYKHPRPYVQPASSTPITSTELSQVTAIARPPATAKAAPLPQTGYFTLITVEDSSEADHLNAKGVAEARRGAYVSAVEDFDQAIAADPSKAVYWMNRAEALRILEFPERAVSDLTEAQKLEPENSVILNKLLLARIENGDRKTVEEFLRKNALADSNKYSGPRGRAAAALLALQMGNTDQAIAYLLALQEKLSPQDFRIMLHDRQLARFVTLPELQRKFGPILAAQGPQ